MIDCLFILTKSKPSFTYGQKGAHAMTLAYPYYRVSTDAQGVSGLGIEAQELSVQQFASHNQYELGRAFYEVESGRNVKNRPELKRVLALCRKTHATLLIATLDRLARSVLFIATLIASKTSFTVVDQPNASKFSLHIQAAVAEEESDRTSMRTHLALQAAKRRGVKLGTACKLLALKNKLTARRFAREMLPLIHELTGQGFTTIRALAKELNRLHVPTFRQWFDKRYGHHVRGMPKKKVKWHRTTVCNLLRLQATL